MKHTIKIIITFLIISGLLTGCGSQESIYTEDDLNWRDEQSRVVIEHNDKNPEDSAYESVKTSLDS